jgi:HK97 family phage major capsid protein
MRTKSVVLAEFQAKAAEQKAILAKGDGLSVEDVTKAEGLETEIETLETELKQLNSAEELARKNAAREAQMNEIARPGVSGGAAGGNGGGENGSRKSGTIVPVYRGNIRSFSGTKQEKMEKAYRFGMFCFAALTGSEKATRFCKENGIALNMERNSKAAGQREGENTAGGFLVPDEFESDLIDLREEYGVVRRLFKNVGMSSDTKNRPRRTGGLKAYAVGEGKAAADSKKGWDNVSLAAKKIMVLAKYSNELDEDSIIEIGDDLADEIGYAFAIWEDEAGLLGDGTSVYHKILGLAPTLLAVDADPDNVKGLVRASGNLWSEITLTDFTAVKGRLPRYARRKKGNVRWVCSQSFYHNVMERLMLSSGGVTAAELAAGRDQEQFMGFPVEISQAMPDEEANAQVPVLFGAYDLAAMFGDRKQTTIAMSTDVYFEEDEIAIRGTERLDINCHDVGDTNVAGPVVGLVTADS